MQSLTFKHEVEAVKTDDFVTHCLDTNFLSPPIREVIIKAKACFVKKFCWEIISTAQYSLTLAEGEAVKTEDFTTHCLDPNFTSSPVRKVISKLERIS